MTHVVNVSTAHRSFHARLPLDMQDIADPAEAFASFIRGVQHLGALLRQPISVQWDGPFAAWLGGVLYEVTS